RAPSRSVALVPSARLTVWLDPDSMTTPVKVVVARRARSTTKTAAAAAPANAVSLQGDQEITGRLETDDQTRSMRLSSTSGSTNRARRRGGCSIIGLSHRYPGAPVSVRRRVLLAPKRHVRCGSLTCEPV